MHIFQKEYESGRKENSFHPFLQELTFVQRRQNNLANLAVAPPKGAPVAKVATPAQGAGTGPSNMRGPFFVSCYCAAVSWLARRKTHSHMWTHLTRYF
jgi:hypothetical protein